MKIATVKVILLIDFKFYKELEKKSQQKIKK